MYKKSVIKKMGSIVVVAAMLASAFTVMSVGNAAGASSANVAINEIMYNPASGNEWVELFNSGDSTVNLTGWVIKDAANNTFGDLTNVEIPPGEYVVVEETGAVLNNDNDEVHLFDDSMTEVDNATYDDSMGADGNGKTLEYNPVTDTWEESLVDGGTSGHRNSVLWPAVTVDYPAGGEVIGGIIPVQWTATSPEGLDLTIKIEYKNETGTDWTLVADNEENDGTYNWDVTALSANERYMVKVTATDTMGDSGSDVSALFNITPLTVMPKTASYNEVTDVHVDGTSGTVTLYYPNGTIYAQQDGSPGDVYFFSTTFDKTGLWYVEDTEKGRAYIWVKPIELNVTASPTEVNFARSGTESYVEVSGTVTNPDGSAAADAVVEIWAPGVTPSSAGTPLKTTTANATGHFAFTDKLRVSLYGAGIYNITARKGAIGNADAFGYTALTVNAISANVSLYTIEGVSGGFSTGQVVFEVTYPEGDALLAGNKYNVSVFKGDKLYAWKNTSDGSSGGNITFTTYGKYLNMTAVDIWELGDYTLKVKADYSGSNDWEYTGEGTFTIPSPDPVNVFVTPSKINVLEPSANAQVITVQVLGKTRYTYGDPTNLSIGAGNKNITERIKIEGDVLYSPPADAYVYVGEGKWNITIFPAKGDGTIYINVSWPGNDTVGKTITVEKGGSASVTPASIIVDQSANISVVVKDQYGNPVNNANVTLVYETGTYGAGAQVTNGSILGDGSPGKGSQGKYDFTAITSTEANTNIIVIAKFTSGGEMVYGYAVIRSEAAHDLAVTVSPAAVLLGEKTKFDINITRDGKAYGTDLEVYIMNATQLQKFHEDYNELTGMVPATKVSEGNYTYSNYFTEEGTYYIYIRTPNEKHDNLNGEVTFEVTKATVTVSPSMLVKNVDKNMTLVFTVEWNGAPVNGTLKVKGIKEIASYEAYADGEEIEVPIVNGEGNITNVTAVKIGNVTFEFKPAADGSEYADADGELKVVVPTISVEPDKIFLAEENLITLTVKHPLTGQPCPGLEVSGDFPSGHMVLGKTDANGKVMIGIVPSITGTIKLYVEGDVAGEINIVLGLKILVSSEIEKGKEITITVTTRGGKAVEGATVKFGGETVGTTDSNGEVKYKPADTGDFTITAEKSNYEKATKDVTVKEGPSTPGFEMIGVILGALAAILLIRRRRK